MSEQLHEHEHEHEHACACCGGHEHEHEHGHEHEHEHHHEHGHEHGCGCGCGHDHHHGGEEPKSLLPLLISAILFFLGWLLPLLLEMPAFVQPIWMAAAAIWPLIPVLEEALEELKDRSMGENVLLVIAVIAAFAIGEFVDGTLVLLLFSLGEWLEDKAVDKSRDAVASLAAVTPDTARRLNADGTEEEIPATAVAVGDRLLVLPHSRVPVDCRVLEGSSEADTSALTGESQPEAVTAGSQLLSGTVNGNGTLTVEALHATEDSAAARILQMVEEASARKGQSEKFITRFARIYTPAVTGLAVLVAAVPPLLGAGAFTTWLYRALVFLVASCPCALVISIPLGFYAGIAASARRGVLLKGGKYVEKLAKVQAVAFDKTGTLTTGALTLDRVVPAPGTDAAAALAQAAALEQYSTHPLARAICEAAGTVPAAPEGLQELPGVGVAAGSVACGGLRLLEEKQIALASLPQEMQDASAFLVTDGAVTAAFFVKAQLQEGAAKTVAELGQLGVSRQVMLTGDRRAQADEVAAAVGLSDVRAELLPEDKLAAVQDLQQTGLTTAFVGDGINDAPVLAAADVGIAMGLGSPAAIETADAVLVSGGLSGLPGAVRLCRRVMRIVRENIVFALAVKAAVLVLAVCGFAPMWLAVFADMGVTLISVGNVLRLLAGQKQA